MISEMARSLVHEEPSSIYIKAYHVVTLLALIYLAFSEVIGKHLQYSKFSNSNKSTTTNNKQIMLPSKIGMLLLYTPAFLAGFSSFWIFPDSGFRFLMLKSAVTIHFLKRDLEVLFIHKFSGFMGLGSVILISATYFTAAASMVYFQHLVEGFSEPPLIDLKYIGLLVFVVGICGNFYHHYILSKLRGSKSEKGYKIPTGGLFGLVICPHYLFEILTFIGISFIAQTTYSYLCAVGIALYLSGRSYATRNWYLSKFENFPKNVKALIPYVF